MRISIRTLIFRHRFAARKGKKRAIVATGRTILVILFPIRNKQHPSRDLGADYFDCQSSKHPKGLCFAAWNP